jgi:hypothetical protein
MVSSLISALTIAKCLLHHWIPVPVAQSVATSPLERSDPGLRPVRGVNILAVVAWRSWSLCRLRVWRGIDPRSLQGVAYKASLLDSVWFTIPIIFPLSLHVLDSIKTWCMLFWGTLVRTPNRLVQAFWIGRLACAVFVLHFSAQEPKTCRRTSKIPEGTKHAVKHACLAFAECLIET